MGKKPDAAANVTMRRYASQQTATLLRRLAYEVGRTAKSGDERSVHDLRVAIRRLAQCLRVFGQFFPRGKARKIRRALKDLIDLASEVRNRDVAAVLLAQAKIGPDNEMAKLLAVQRGAARRALSAELKQWVRSNVSNKWRALLEI